MKQNKKGSALETLVNILIGYWFSFFANMMILPYFGFDVTMKQNVLIGSLFTIISVIRQFSVRRTFNHFGWFCEEK